VPRLPAPREIGFEVRRRARRVWYGVEDAAYAARRVPGWLGARIRDLWSGLSLGVRRWIGAVAGIVALAAAIWLLVVPAIPCQLPGGDRCPPDDDARALVPGDALAYLHVNVDPDTEQYERAAAITGRLPRLTDQVITRLVGGLSGVALDFPRQVSPWLGGETALALVGGRGQVVERALLLEVDDQAGADEFAKELTGGETESKEYRGVPVRAAGQVSTAIVGGFLVLAPRAALERVIDTEVGPGRSLEESEPAEEVAEELPDDGVAAAYISAEGAEDLFRAGAPLGSFEAFVNSDATRGVGAALVAAEDALELEMQSLLDAERLKGSPGFFSAFPAFEPSLADEFSSGSLLYLGIGDPQQSVRALLAQASAEAPQLVAGFEEFSERLSQEGKVNFEREVLSVLGGEAALGIEPPPEGGEDEGGEQGPGATEAEAPLGLPPEGPGAPLPGGPAAGAEVPFTGAPYVDFVAEGVDEEQAREALADLQVPIARALDPSESGQAPVFEDQKIEGLDAPSLRISPTINLTYALFGGKLVVATDPAGVSQVKAGDRSLEDSDRFEAATDGFSDELSAILYLNLADLIGLAEREGLAADPSYALFAEEIRELDALGLAVLRAEERIETRARLTVGE
jgi:hypothetical protein